jgi:DUF2933 family protein
MHDEDHARGGMPRALQSRDMSSSASSAQRDVLHIPFTLGLCVFLAIAFFFLWEEHRAHLFGMLPYALLLLCPFIHLFMHRGHTDHEAAAGNGGHRHRLEGGRQS